jgi:hypothetical protein
VPRKASIIGYAENQPGVSRQQSHGFLACRLPAGR